MVGVAPYVGINMSLFDYLKTNYGTDEPIKRDLCNMVFGSVSGIAAVMVIYPADVMRRKL